jgi:hypothetical protein
MGLIMRLVDQLPQHNDMLLRGSDEGTVEPLTDQERDQQYADWYWDRYFHALVY